MLRILCALANHAQEQSRRKQKTAKGYEIPVPNREDFEKVLKKASKAARRRRTK